MLLPSTTGIVTRLKDGRVRKTHPAVMGEAGAAQLEALMRDLHGKKLPVPELLSRETLPDGTVVTYWRDLGDSTSPIDYFTAGVALKRLHGYTPTVTLPQLYTQTYFAALFQTVQDRTDQWGPLCEALQAHLETSWAHVKDEETSFVHDDFWPKNLISDSSHRLWVLDWDNACIAPPRHDLAFLTRAAQRGYISRGEAYQFEQGYGAPLPSVEKASHYANVHRIRWVLSLMDRTLAGERSAAKQLAEDEPLWTKDESPV